MPALIACLSSGKGTWTHLLKIMNKERWDKVILITNEFGKERFNHPVEFIIVDFNKESNQLVDDIVKQLKDKVFGEVAVNLSSGIGKEHMAILSAIMKSGLAFRLIDLVDDKIVDLTNILQ